MYLKYFYLKNSIGKTIILFVFCVCSKYMKISCILYFMGQYKSILYFVFQILTINLII